MEFEIVHINTSYGMVLSSVAKFIHGKAKSFSVFAVLHRNKYVNEVSCSVGNDFPLACITIARA